MYHQVVMMFNKSICTILYDTNNETVMFDPKIE